MPPIGTTGLKCHINVNYIKYVILLGRWNSQLIEKDFPREQKSLYYGPGE